MLSIIQYPYRGNVLKRSPKVEFKKNATIGHYRWGQSKVAYNFATIGFPEVLQKLVDKIGDENINHIIVIKYTNGMIHHIPWHNDKQEGVEGHGAKDIVGETTIYDVVVCDKPRVFQLARYSDIPESEDGHSEATQYAFNQAMTHGSMITISAQGNKTMKHRVPKEHGWKGNRFSIVLRCVKKL